MKLKVLNGDEIRRAVTMLQAIQAVEEAFIQFSSGKAVLPLRTPITPDLSAGTSLFMPAYLPSLEALGTKVISIFPGNIARGLPTIHALVLMLDAKTGIPRGLLDGAALTALRTGAASGVATKYLSRPDAAVVAVFGAGIQGRSQLEAMCAVRHITKAFIWDPLPERASAFSREMASRGNPVPHEIRVAASPLEAVIAADIICTATTSSTPVFNDSDVKPGTHINAIGSYEPHVQEIPAETVRRAKVVVDSIEAALAETGDLIIPLKAGLFTRGMIHGEIGQVASGEIAGRESTDEVTLFKSVGLAVQDMAAGHLALRAAHELGLGLTIEV